MKKLSPILVLLISFQYTLNAQTLHLYGGSDQDVYLGCLNCSDLSSSSVWNDLGTYGSGLSTNSIWNDLGRFGSDLSNYSPWNDIASEPPIIVDKEGNFYGYFTTNTTKAKRADFELALIMYKYHNLIKDDVGKWYDEIFQ